MLAIGPFGQLWAPAPPLRPAAEGDAFTVALGVELARVGALRPDEAALWSRALARGHAATLRAERASGRARP